MDKVVDLLAMLAYTHHVTSKLTHMDYTKSIAVELETGEREQEELKEVDDYSEGSN